MNQKCLATAEREYAHSANISIAASDSERKEHDGGRRDMDDTITGTRVKTNLKT